MSPNKPVAPFGVLFFYKYLSRRTSHETAQISNEAVQGLRRPRCRETARTSQEGIRQDLETQGRRQTIYSQMDSGKDLILL